jgi:predicted nucleic acid-binding protein
VRVLVDTNIWIDHLRQTEPVLVRLIENDQVFTHSAIVGELLLGSIKNRLDFVHYLAFLPKIDEASPLAVYTTIERCGWPGSGVGWVDAQLLTAVMAYPCRLWTRDARLAKLAQQQAVAWPEPLIGF